MDASTKSPFAARPTATLGGQVGGKASNTPRSSSVQSTLIVRRMLISIRFQIFAPCSVKRIRRIRLSVAHSHTFNESRLLEAIENVGKILAAGQQSLDQLLDSHPMFAHCGTRWCAQHSPLLCRAAEFGQRSRAGLAHQIGNLIRPGKQMGWLLRNRARFLMSQSRY
jgi:hypothetical protein